jgi:hypothetical protein
MWDRRFRLSILPSTHPGAAPANASTASLYPGLTARARRNSSAAFEASPMNTFDPTAVAEETFAVPTQAALDFMRDSFSGEGLSRNYFNEC